MMNGIAPGQTGQKVETYTFPGPINARFPQIILPFDVISMVVTNATAQTLYFDMNDYPSVSSAKIIIPPLQVYHVHGWFDNHIFIQAAGNILTSEFVTIQACDHMTTLPMASLATSFIPTTITPGDGTSNPTAPPEISFQMVFNASTGLWERQRVASVDNLPTAGVSAAGNMVFNTITGQWDRQRVATGDNLPTTGLSASANMVFDTASGQWFRSKQASPTNVISQTTGLPASVPHIWDQTGLRYLPATSPFGDGMNAAFLQSVGGMIIDPVSLTWDRPSSPSSDTLGYRGHPAISPLVYNVTGNNWSRIRETADGLNANSGILGTSPLLVGSVFNRAREASSGVIGSAAGTGVGIVVEPGHWAVATSQVGGASGLSVLIAGLAGARRVLRALVASLSNSVAPGSFQNFAVLVRDGVSGVGAVIGQYNVFLPNIIGIDRIIISPISLFSSIGGPLTIEFNGAPSATSTETISVEGYNALQ